MHPSLLIHSSTPTPMTTTFDSAARAFSALAPLRARRARQINFTFGRQWSDTTVVDGRAITEGEYTERRGKKPLANNLIRQMVKTVVGRFRHRLATENARAADDPMTLIATFNSLDEMDCRMLEEFLISGCAIQRVTAERRPAGAGVWIDNVDPARFFVNAFTDPRGLDIELVGMIHDMSFRELAGRFAPGGGKALDRLKAIYASSLDGDIYPSAVASPFGIPAPGRCRAVEVWTLDAETSSQGFADLRWQCRWYAPDGTEIASFPSPWAHASHPFAVKFYPLTGGEVHSLVEDVIDQQKYINRLITLIDHVIGTSAKGALLFPIDTLPAGMDFTMIADQWARPDGIIPYQPGNPGVVPQQVISGKEPSSAYHLLDMELKLLQQVSGVNDTLIGATGSDARASAALFEARMNASGIALLDTFAAFDAFRTARDTLALGL